VKLSHYKLALAMIIGGGLGAAVVQGLHAQAKPPVYLIALNKVKNAEGYTKQYLPKAQAAIKAHGGVYVAGGHGTQIDGTLPTERVVILRWDSMETLKAWHDSPQYQAARRIGENYADLNTVAVNGAAQ